MKKIISTSLVALATLVLHAQNPSNDPKATEVWEPKPPVVKPGATPQDAPSDAIVLFGGKDLNEWVSGRDTSKTAPWPVADGAFTVKKGTGSIQTRRSFLDYQLHLEWKIPAVISGSGQARGNSGVFLASTGAGDQGYEIQVLDNYKNETYVNGQVGSIYKQYIPLANACKEPGQWQTFDIVWTAPRFNADGSLLSPARVTAFHNGVLVQNNVSLKGATVYIGQPNYNKAHGASPVKLQDHGDPSEPISFRNIWIRPL